MVVIYHELHKTPNTFKKYYDTPDVNTKYEQAEIRGEQIRGNPRLTTFKD